MNRDGQRQANKLHIRCGSDIRHGLTEAGLDGDFLEFSDPFCQGPLQSADRGAWIEQRSQFIARYYELDIRDCRKQLQQAYQDLDQVGRYQQIVLWFEHDPYDQLILIYLLRQFAPLDLGSRLQLICINHFPGVEPFHGLGQLSPAQLRQLWREQRQPVTQSQFQSATEAWQALTNAHWSTLNGLFRPGSASLPYLGSALKRLCQELPWKGCGLGLTQQLVIEILKEQGPLMAGRLFRTLCLEKEPLPHLGDLMFWALLKQMRDSRLVSIEQGNGDWPSFEVSMQPSLMSHPVQAPWWVGPCRLSDPNGPVWDEAAGKIDISRR